MSTQLSRRIHAQYDEVHYFKGCGRQTAPSSCTTTDHDAKMGCKSKHLEKEGYSNGISQDHVLEMENRKLKRDWALDKVMLEEQILELEQELQASQEHIKQMKQHSHNDDFSTQHSSSRAPDKSIKRKRNLRRNRDVLKAEYEDLQLQIQGQKAIIHCKEKTIQRQRELLDEVFR